MDMAGSRKNRYRRWLDNVRADKKSFDSVLDAGDHEKVSARRLNRWMGKIIKLSGILLEDEEDQEAVIELDKIRNIHSSRRDNTAYIKDILIAADKILPALEERIKKWKG